MSIVTINGIPVYDAIISDEECGMFKISLVDNPAGKSNFMAFDSQRRPLMYAIEDEEKRLVRGCIMRADFPIYRRDDRMGEYYVIYKADQIRKMAEKYLLEGRQNDVNLMHQEGSDVDGVQMVQYFIKGDGVSVEGFDECADGSLFGEFHITNDEIWEQVKAGTYQGFSLEGVFDLAPEQDRDEVQEIVDGLKGMSKKLSKYFSMSKLNKVRAILAKMLQGFGNVTTDRGILAWDGDEDLKEGNEVFIEDAEGNRSAAEDGDYRTMDNKVIVVVDGKVAEIKDPEAEVESEFVETDKGKLMWDNEDRDLQAGDAVYVEDSEGNRVPAPDGDYTTEDGKVIKVADGKVAEIVDPRAEVAEEKYGRKETDKGELLWEGEEDLKAGDPVFVESEEGLKPAPDGDYETGDGKVIKVAEGVVAEIVDKEAEVADQPSEEMKALQEENASLKAEKESLQAENEALKAEVEKLRKTPAAKPAHQEFSSSAELGKTGNKRLDNLARILSAK